MNFLSGSRIQFCDSTDQIRDQLLHFAIYAFLTYYRRLFTEIQSNYASRCQRWLSNAEYHLSKTRHLIDYNQSLIGQKDKTLFHVYSPMVNIDTNKLSDVEVFLSRMFLHMNEHQKGAMIIYGDVIMNG